MARTAAGNRLTAQHRAEQIRLRAAAYRDLLALWGAVDPTNLRQTIGPFANAAAVLARFRFIESADLAVAYYRALRAAEGVSGSVTIVPPDPPRREEAASLIRGAALSGILNARRRGFSVEAAAQNGYVKASGSLSGLVLAGSRQLIAGAALGDRRARGWKRVTSGTSCDWCQSEAGALLESDSFRTHDHCDCAAEPEFS